MTIDKLKEIFRFQLVASVDYEPNGKLEYLLFVPHMGPQTVVKNDDEWEAILEQVKDFEHDGYRNKVPTFVKTEAV